jgi:hypothetical protein
MSSNLIKEKAMSNPAAQVREQDSSGKQDSTGQEYKFHHEKVQYRILLIGDIKINISSWIWN